MLSRVAEQHACWTSLAVIVEFVHANMQKFMKYAQQSQWTSGMNGVCTKNKIE